MVMVPSLMRFGIISDVIQIHLFVWRDSEKGEFLFVPLYERIWVTIEDQSLIGCIIGSVVLH